MGNCAIKKKQDQHPELNNQFRVIDQFRLNVMSTRCSLDQRERTFQLSYSSPETVGLFPTLG
ncbi:MAG: hypothetical protein CSA81_12580 [Acidobacteria bacterium]|nr:MAG: hypothetical protein CSA81_12580 [Acidobacteriota bacterium]